MSKACRSPNVELDGMLYRGLQVASNKDVDPPPAFALLQADVVPVVCCSSHSQKIALPLTSPDGK
jgi:hypothetical protein